MQKPAIFDLNRYNCATWTYETWRNAFFYRRVASTRMQWVTEAAGTKWSENATADLIKIIESFFSDPSGKINVNQAGPQSAIDSKEDLGVRDRTILDEFSSLDKFKNGELSPWEHIHAVWTNEDVSDLPTTIREAEPDIARLVHELEHRPLWQVQQRSATPDFFVSVALNKPDAELVRDFKDWLKRTRRDSGLKAATSPITASHIDKWHDSRVLAYIDLCLYAKVLGSKFTIENMASTLFGERLSVDASDDFSDVDKLRTTRKYAESIMKDTFFHSMRNSVS